MGSEVHNKWIEDYWKRLQEGATKESLTCKSCGKLYKKIEDFTSWDPIYGGHCHSCIKGMR